VVSNWVTALLTRLLFNEFKKEELETRSPRCSFFAFFLIVLENYRVSFQIEEIIKRRKGTEIIDNR